MLFLGASVNFISRPFFIFLVAISLTGCFSSGVKIPPTFAVRGTVVDAQGKPFTEGSVQFRMADNPIVVGNAQVNPDGSFELKTMIEGKLVAGTLPGSHQVTYYPVMSAAQSEVPVAIPKPIVVEEKENTITINVPKAN